MGRRWMNDVCGRRRSIDGDTDPGMWTSVNNSASGKRSHSTSSARSPPRMPVNQSWTKAIFMTEGGGGLDSRRLVINLPNAPHRLLPRKVLRAREALSTQVAPQGFVG